MKCPKENTYSKIGQLTFAGTKSMVHTTKVIIEDLLISMRNIRNNLSLVK